MKYGYIDGDDIGLRIEKCFMVNDENQLHAINEEITSLIFKISNFLKNEGCSIIFSGADGIIFKNENPNALKIYRYIKSIHTSVTFSIGVGNSLREAFLALRYIKANGKDGVAILEDDFELLNNEQSEQNAKHGLAGARRLA